MRDEEFRLLDPISDLITLQRSHGSFPPGHFHAAHQRFLLVNSPM